MKGAEKGPLASLMSLLGMLKDALLSFSPDNRVNYLGLGYWGKVETVYLKNVREYLHKACFPNVVRKYVRYIYSFSFY